MWLRVVFGLSLLLVLRVTMTHGQQYGERCIYVNEFDTPISLDSLTIIPESIRFPNSSEFSSKVNLSDGTVTITGSGIVDSLLVCFKVLPYSLHKRFFRRNLSIYDSNAIFKDKRLKDPLTLNRNELFPTAGINKSGTISRGLSFGNNQDVFVNSTLNLNLEGKLTDDLNIRASITDQNVPYQPEGNTQQLQDFDNVFIQIYNDNFSITGGDVVLQNQASHFLKYYKNVQGGLAEVNYKVGKTGKATTKLGLSVAKGQFASVQIKAIEGLSGPYRIPGPDGQSFIIVLANSERVFVDGIRMERGFNKDYIIDYNSGLLTFNTRVLITEFTRIRIDYEFSDQNYNRTIAAASHYQESGKLSLFANAYSEKDSRNRPLLVDLTNQDKLLLSTIGDNIDQAVIGGADSVGFNNQFVLYEKRDTLDSSGVPTSIFQFSTNPESAFFRVSFSDVGEGMGNYIQESTLANGRVFKWVSPINGEPQGRFEPVIPVPVPNKKQMTTIGGAYKLTSYERVFGELAFSSLDKNLFSELDSDNDNGYAFKLGIVSEERPVSFLKDYKLNAAADFELDDKNFNAIDRFRYIEYDRDWSFDPTTDLRRFDDHILNAQIGLVKDDRNKVAYRLSRRKRGDQIDGFQHGVDFNKSFGKLHLRTSLFDLTNRQIDRRSDWTRYKADLSYNSKYLVPGYRYHQDHNQIVLALNDSVTSSALYFDEHTVYIKNGEEAGVKFDLNHTFRKDQRPLEGAIENYSTSNTTQLSLQQKFKNNDVDVTFIYREQDFDQVDEITETISGRLDWSGNWFDRHVRSELTYAIANSNEPRREFIYIQVPAGQGTHTWRDQNEDGIQDLNEFFEAMNPDERNYAKIFVPTNEFISAFQNLFIYRLSLDAPRKWKKEKGLKQFLSRFSNNTSWSADTKTTESDVSDRALAFARNIDQADLLGEKSSLRSTLFYNRANSTYGADVSLLKQQQKQQLTNGFEFRSTDQYNVNLRLNLSRQYAVRLRNTFANKEVGSDFLTDRNYSIHQYKFNPEFSWQPATNLRVSLQYSYLNKENQQTAESTESALFHEFKGEIKLNRAAKSTINAGLRWVDIDFEGVENSPIGYELLDALRPGQNITWTLNWLQKVTNGLQLNISYDGRKSESSKIIHVGRVQVSALF